MSQKGFKILLPEYKIQRRTWEIAKSISEKHRGQLPPVMICVLSGGFMFFTELVKSMDIDVQVDFIRAKSYNEESNTPGQLQITKDIELDIFDKTVYIVDDILESGNTMKELIIHFSQKSPKDIFSVTMLKRKNCTHPIDYYGFEIDDEKWAYGFGMDNKGIMRNYRNIYIYE